MKHLISFIDKLNRFEVMHFQLMAVLENWVFSSSILGAGEKKSKVGDQPWHHPDVVCKFCGDPLRNRRRVDYNFQACANISGNFRKISENFNFPEILQPYATHIVRRQCYRPSLCPADNACMRVDAFHAERSKPTILGLAVLVATIFIPPYVVWAGY